MVGPLNMIGLNSPKTSIMFLFIKTTDKVLGKKENKGMNKKYISNIKVPFLIPFYLHQARWNLWLKIPRSKKNVRLLCCNSIAVNVNIWKNGCFSFPLSLPSFLQLFFFFCNNYSFYC